MSSIVDLSLRSTYSPEQPTESLFEKIIDSQSHAGGYCMENNALFGTVLRNLEYSITSVGGRVNEAAQPMSASKNWKGPKHDGYQNYLIDVAFGSNGSHKPVPLIQDYEFHNTGALHRRIIYGPISRQTRMGQQL
ncbi:arylamine N-acetyltransferase 2 [Penicillium canescens]|nr:arylamine N-acetyltransferase 2 [Penicillium canescens]